MADDAIVPQRDGRSVERMARLHQPQRKPAVGGMPGPHGVNRAHELLNSFGDAQGYLPSLAAMIWWLSLSMSVSVPNSFFQNSTASRY